VADTFDRCKIKIWLVFLIVAGDLSIANPWGPLLLNRPVKVLNPVSSSEHWYSTISVSREEEHLEFRVVLHDAVNPEGAFILLMPLGVNVIITLNPSRVTVHEEVVLNAELVLHVLLVQIITYFSSANL